MKIDSSNHQQQPLAKKYFPRVGVQKIKLFILRVETNFATPALQIRHNEIN